MKVLIYGGCHASALKRIFDKYAVSEVHSDALTNFQLIASGTPFPYERLKEYDAILFNPILNRAEYNTTFVEEYCNHNGIRFYRYPWLQWGGYWPTPKRRTWGARNEWGLFYMHELANRYREQRFFSVEEGSFDEYYESLFLTETFAPVMDAEVEATTRQLQMREREGRVDFEISGFILDNFRERQLFMTPDHPATELYKFVVEKIVDALGIRIDPSFYSSKVEVQEGIRTPIPPGVANVLGLKFGASDWGNNEFLGDAYYSLRDYARTIFHAEEMRLATAMHNTRVKFPGSEKALSVRFNERVLVRLLGESTHRDHYSVEVMAPVRLRRPEALIYKSHWKLDAPNF